MIAMTQQYRLNPINSRLNVWYKMLFLFICLLSSGATLQANSEKGPIPTTELSPQEVIDIVIEALQFNSEDTGDEGIATVYRFASPGNRSNTGPLERFTKMVKGGFSDMLNHRGARFDNMEVTDDVAVQAVWLLTSSGKEVGYAFQLGKQKSGDYSGMWMTEAVVPLGNSRNGTRI